MQYCTQEEAILHSWRRSHTEEICKVFWTFKDLNWSRGAGTDGKVMEKLMNFCVCVIQHLQFLQILNKSLKQSQALEQAAFGQVMPTTRFISKLWDASSWHSTWLGTVRRQLLVLHDPGRSDDDVCPLALAQCSWSRCLAIPGAAIGLSLIDEKDFCFRVQGPAWKTFWWWSKLSLLCKLSSDLLMIEV